MKAFQNTPERFADAHSGVEIALLTPDAIESTPLSYDWPSFTPDNEHVIIRCQFSHESNKPSGFYRVRSDGSELFHLSEGGIHPRLTPDGRTLYVLHPESPVLHAIDLETGCDDEICNIEHLLPEGWVYALMRLSPASNHLFIMLRVPDTRPIRVDLRTGEAVRLDDFDGMVWECAADEPRVIVARQRLAEKGRLYDFLSFRRLELEPGDRSLWSLDVDGGDEQLVCVDYYSHATNHGRTAQVQGCGKWGDRSITICEAGKEPRKVCEGPYFWHSGASFDAEWIAADTNWPNYGIQLIHVPTGNFRYLCDSGSSLSDGLKHPHPSLSHDGRIAMFRSDRSGRTQAYLVRIPEAFRRSVIAGESGEYAPVWIPKKS
jgi:hypothetical protein